MATIYIMTSRNAFDLYIDMASYLTPLNVALFNTLEMLLLKICFWRILIQVFIKSLIISQCFNLIKKKPRVIAKK